MPSPTFRLPKVFHVTHVVDDFDAAVAWYEDVFAPRSGWGRLAGGDDGGAGDTGAGAAAGGGGPLGSTRLALLSIGPTVLMPLRAGPGMGPERFRERMGQRLHSFALYVDEPQALIDHLTAQGQHLADFLGQPVTDPLGEIWTRPRESPLVFEFFQPREGMGDPRYNDPDWSTAYWRDEHPLGIRSSFVSCVTADPATATAFLVDGLFGTVVHEATTPHGTRSTFVQLSDEVTIEVAEPLDASSPAGQDLAVGALLHAVTFRVADLDRATAHLEAKGVRTEQVAPGHVTAEPADTFGARFRLTDRDLTDW
jgi:catechol 2,3-dioxygenase-like lactoylglutathione lyase family enzyme